jgi:hypothetical protein
VATYQATGGKSGENNGIGGTSNCQFMINGGNRIIDINGSDYYYGGNGANGGQGGVGGCAPVAGNSPGGGGGAFTICSGSRGGAGRVVISW